MYVGGCLCGAVRFEIKGKIRNIVYCHCSQCRKAQGSAYASNGIVAKTDFSFTLGETVLTGYESPQGQTKYFCRHCGSPIVSKNIAHPNQIRIRLGTIETTISEKPQAHIFVDSKAEWDKICDSLPQYSEYEPNR